MALAAMAFKSRSQQTQLFCHIIGCVEVGDCCQLMGERDLHFFLVTGTHYGTKTPPGQQPTNLCIGDITGGDVSTTWFTGMAFMLETICNPCRWGITQVITLVGPKGFVKGFVKRPYLA